MGQGLSCSTSEEQGLFSGVKLGDLETVEAVLERDSALLHHSTVYDRNSLLHIAAANGQIEILSLLLNRSVKPDMLNRHKQTPLMLAAMHGKISCVKKLIESVQMYAKQRSFVDVKFNMFALCGYYGHSDCLQAILSAARTSQVSASGDTPVSVNIRDSKGATPCICCSSKTPSMCSYIAGQWSPAFPAVLPFIWLQDVVRLIASEHCWLGVLIDFKEMHQVNIFDTIQENTIYSSFKTPPRSMCSFAESVVCRALVWPSPLKFISELNQDAKSLLEQALMAANREREKVILKGTVYSLPSPSASDSGIDDDVSEASDTDLCCICFDQICTIEVQECGHRMSNIVKLVVAKVRTENDIDRDVNSSKPRKSWRSRHLSEGSSSFKGLSAVGSFGKMSRGSGRIAAESELLDKPLSLDT
ncbi:UNVERIFIED_CONTAM: putative E3 ubiquitin-protein ligase XBAT31 [Sesamum angustifolium]|uniref:E3 ubiquitin-protein ligase XBAT31 n=1 Tax=Sesamum angustifolium TaxID=2727405 RepID=A0AAW2QQY9_9LAMI